MPDEYEKFPDYVKGSAPDAANYPYTCHTLYPVGDVDYVKFNVNVPRKVTVKTFNLTNGADTMLQIVDANDTAVIGKDDAPVVLADDPASVSYQAQRCNRLVPVPGPYMGGANNGERLASAVTFDAQPGTYYAMVTSSTKGPSVGAGTMGSYGLQVILR